LPILFFIVTHEKEINSFFSISGLKSKSDIIKGIILKINEDIVQPKQPKYINKLKVLATAFY
jgi:predicted translin family RNA/ssDNA-binding protein